MDLRDYFMDAQDEANDNFSTMMVMMAMMMVMMVMITNL